MTPDAYPLDELAGLIEDAENHRDGDTADALRRLAKLERLLAQDVSVEHDATHTGYEAIHYDHGEGRDTWAYGNTPLAALLSLAVALEVGDA